MQIRVSPNSLQCSAEEWQARIDLAAAHRLAFMHGFSEGIFNHLTLTVPGRSDRYYQIPFGMHWSEVTASSFMEVGIDDGTVRRGTGEVMLMDAIAYDDNYAGPAFDPAEGKRLAKIIGNKTVLFMANHGVTTLGVTVAEAYNRLYYLERAAQVQIYAMWTGQPLKPLPAAVVEKTKREISEANFYDPPPAQRHFDALKRILDRTEPDYKT